MQGDGRPGFDRRMTRDEINLLPIIPYQGEVMVVRQPAELEQELGRFSSSGFVDLANMAKQQGIKNHGLRGLAAVLMGGARKSNWAREDLSDRQI